MYLRQTSQYHIDFSVTNDKTNKNFSRGRNSLRGWIWSRTRWLKRFPERISRYDSSDCKYFISDVQSHGNSHHQSLNLELYDRKYGIRIIMYHGLWYKTNCYFGSKFLSKEFFDDWWSSLTKVTVRIQIFDRPTVWIMFDLCYDVINRCKLWKLSRTHSCLLIWPWREQRHHG